MNTEREEELRGQEYKSQLSKLNRITNLLSKLNIIDTYENIKGKKALDNAYKNDIIIMYSYCSFAI